MNLQNKAPSRGRGRSIKKNERLSPEEQVKQLLSDHKKSLGEMICIKIDERTSIELPASMSISDREKRIKNYLKNTNFRPVK